MIYIWVRSRNCGCLVTWFCYQLIAKPGSKTAAVSWPDPYINRFVQETKPAPQNIFCASVYVCISTRQKQQTQDMHKYSICITLNNIQIQNKIWTSGLKYPYANKYNNKVPFIFFQHSIQLIPSNIGVRDLFCCLLSGLGMASTISKAARLYPSPIHESLWWGSLPGASFTNMD